MEKCANRIYLLVESSVSLLRLPLLSSPLQRRTISLRLSKKNEKPRLPKKNDQPRFVRPTGLNGKSVLLFCCGFWLMDIPQPTTSGRRRWHRLAERTVKPKRAAYGWIDRAILVFVHSIIRRNIRSKTKLKISLSRCSDPVGDRGGVRFSWFYIWVIFSDCSIEIR